MFSVGMGETTNNTSGILLGDR